MTRKICRILLFTGFLVGLVRPIAFADNNVEQILRQTLLGKTVLLRTPYSSGSLRFNSRGNLEGSSDTGTLATDGLLFVENISLKKDALEIKGKRCLLVMSFSSSARFAAVPTKRGLKLSVALSSPVTSEAQVLQLVKPILIIGDLSDQFDRYWKPRIDITRPCDDKKTAHDSVVGYLEGDRAVYFCAGGDNLTPPRVIYSPEPDLGGAVVSPSPKTETLHLRVIVNEQGLPELLGVVGDPGKGLAEKALLAVSRWKFKPALKQGKPVAVVISVEVEFFVD